MWAKIAIAGALGVAGFALVSVGSYAATKQLDPSMGTLTRNQTIAGGLLGLGGIAIATMTDHPFIGAAMAAAGLVVAAGTTLTVALNKLLPSSMSSVYGQMGAYGPMAEYAPMNGIAEVYGQLGAYGPMNGMGEVYGQLGAFTPPAPWAASDNPF